MDCVVRTWLFGTITDDLADTVSEHRASARDIWLAIESQFLGNQATRALYADTDFRTFSQDDLSVADYCRLYKRKAQDLRDLGEPVSDRTLTTSFGVSTSGSRPSASISTALTPCQPSSRSGSSYKSKS
jgi:hypothetical protein